MTKADLIAFEAEIAGMFNAGDLSHVVHLSGGNEDCLMKIFKKIKSEDWCFCTWRNHYHALLKGMPPEVLKKKIMAGQSMHIMDSELRFFSSAIVGGCCSIAAGVAWGIKRRGRPERVFCFVGDGALDQGASYEAIRYVDSWNLPCTFIVEDNGLAGDTPTEVRFPKQWRWPSCVVTYKYKRTWPHCNTGKIVPGYM